MNKGILLRITSVFFVFMFLFTILSRAASQAGTAVVTVARPENRMITHTVKAVGKIVQNQELAVTTEANQRVKGIYVSEGEQVSKGDLLFEIDLDILEEQILLQQQEMEKQSLQVKDAKSQKDVNAQQKSSQQAQAAEQYSLSAKRAQVGLSRAKEVLSEAKAELEAFRKSTGDTQEDGSVEAALTKACEEKTDAYIQAEQELKQLEWEIENAVYVAQQAAKSNGSLVNNETVHTQAAKSNAFLTKEGTVHTQTAEDEILLETAEQEAAWEDFAAAFEYEIDVILPEEAVSNESIQDTASVDESVQETVGVNQPVPDTASADEPAQDTAGVNQPVQDAAGINQTVQDTPETGSGIGESEQMIPETEAVERAFSQEELDQIGQFVRDSYSTQLTAARQKVADTLEEKNAAEAALVEYQQEHIKTTDAQAAQKEKQLIDNVKAAREAYEDAALAASEAAVTSGRAVQQAGIPDPSNSSDRMNEITYEQMELTLAKLEKLKEKDGKIKAPSDGVITKISIMTGEKTSDTTAILMADLSKGLCFEAEITKEQGQYIGTGDLVTLTGNSKKQKLEELPVESVVADESDGDIYCITVQLLDSANGEAVSDTGAGSGSSRSSFGKVFDIGATATMEFSQKSEAYPLCVPLAALHLDEKNQTYVLVPEEYDSVMGTEVRARKVTVTVLDKNETYAALAEGTLTSRQEVIVSSDKAVEAGSRIRISD